MQIEGSAAIVVGGASGLGEATVRRCTSGGAQVTIADVNAEKGEALASELGLSFAPCDVREEDQVQAAVEQAATAAGGLRIAVCCAGTGWAQKVAGSKGPHPLMPFETIIQINLIGTFNVLRFAASAMIANEPLEDGERGVCVNTASIAAFDGQVGQIAYSASKGGVVGHDAARRARPRAVRHPRQHDRAGPVRHAAAWRRCPRRRARSSARAFPIPQRLGQPAEYAQLACQIVENRMLNGETIRLDGALRMPPR